MNYVAILSGIGLTLSGFAWADDRVDYVQQVRPILARRCFACHGALKQQADLRLDTSTFIRKGGDSGAALEAGKADKSLIIQRVSAADLDLRMPPEGEPLTEQEITLLRQWIAGGAKPSVGENPEDDPRRHWAFVRPVRPPLPKVENAEWARNAIDTFVAAGHEQLGLTAQPSASREGLLRRVSLDLIGLPPTRAQLYEFLEDSRADAYERVVDRLLGSLQYGERWARHWMDVWRYSDWYGRRAVDDVRNSYPHIWRWRDWIIRSLNKDKGYDRMLMEMLAADELWPEDDEAIAATGFIVRNWFSLNYDQWMKDLVEHTGKAFLGIRLNCAHCHDHKYDPITQQEYFRFRAFFEPLELRHDRVPGGLPLSKYKRYVPGSGSSLKPIEAGLARIFDEKIDAKTYMYEQGDARNRLEGQPPVAPGVPAILGGDQLKIETIDLPPIAHYPGLKRWVQRQELAKQHQNVLFARSELNKATQSKPPDQAAVRLKQLQLTSAEAQLAAVEARIAADNTRYRNTRGGSSAAVLARAAGQAERSAKLSAARAKQLHTEQALTAARATAETDAKGADALKKLEQQLKTANAAVAAAERDFPEQSDQYTPLSPTYPTRSSGRRSALVQWLASKQNPLTARVAVNHIWMRHFGSPLVESVFDFGRAGKKPSHPELLDWLAVELMQSGWRMKHLHRLIVTSNAYRLRSDFGAADNSNLKSDRNNRFLWRFNLRRMEAETIRDSVLSAAGELDATIGGPVIDNKRSADSRRRSLYFARYPESGGTMKFTSLFDAPDPGDCYRRTESIVPQQALAMTNSRILANSSRLAAWKLAQTIGLDKNRSTSPDNAFITAAFEQILSRSPTLSERTACEEFLQTQTSLYNRTDPEQRSVRPAEGDVASSDKPAMRARESLIHVLFSHNDFVTIR